jgi:hypothetical protein
MQGDMARDLALDLRHKSAERPGGKDEAGEIFGEKHGVAVEVVDDSRHLEAPLSVALESFAHQHRETIS